MVASLPVLQDLYHLLKATTHIASPRPVGLPGAVAEFYSTSASIDLGPKRPPWRLSVEALFADYWTPTPTLEEILENTERARRGETPMQDPGWPAAPSEHPLVLVETDVLSVWLCFMELDGKDDQRLFTYCRDSTNARAGWSREPLPYSEFMFKLVADSALANQVPWSILGPEADRAWDDGSEFAEDEMSELVTPSRWWVRARAEASEESLRLLGTRLGDAQVEHNDGVTTHRFILPKGRLTVSTDGLQAAWWGEAWTETALRELAFQIRCAGGPFGQLVGDAEEVRAMLRDIS